jgi:hypothetical protein
MQKFVIIKFRTTSNCCHENLFSQMCTEREPDCPLKGSGDSYTILNPGHCFNLPQLCESVIRSGLRCWQSRYESKSWLKFILSLWSSSFFFGYFYVLRQSYEITPSHCILGKTLRNHFPGVLVQTAEWAKELSFTMPMGWLILCVTLTGPCSAQIFGYPRCVYEGVSRWD